MISNVSIWGDLEFERENVVLVYDALMETGLMHRLMEQIPEEEISILRGMLDMQRDDVEANSHSLISFFETKYDSIKIAFDSVNKVLDNPEIKEKISQLSK